VWDSSALKGVGGTGLDAEKKSKPPTEGSGLVRTQKKRWLRYSLARVGLLSTQGKGNQQEGGGCNWSVHWEKASQCGAPTNRTCIGGMASGEFCSGDGCEQRKNSATY